MINTAKIKGRIAEKGLTIQKIAPSIPCTAYTLGQQINNKKPMYISTANKLCSILDIVDGEFVDFFCFKSCNNATKEP